MDLEAQVLLQEMQIDELLDKLDKAETSHRNASKRSTAAERQNSKLRKKVEFLENELSQLERCWNCPDLGNKDLCSRCADNSVFTEDKGRFIWRGYPVTQRR